MKVACIIPARGGSKGLPGKNLMPLNGKPLLCWSIEQALGSKRVDGRVFVSSDSDAILSAAEQAGARAIKRPADLASDAASSEDALVHAVKTIEQEGPLDIVAFLQCTSPIRLPDDLDNAIQKLINEEADSLLSVLPITDYFVWQHGNQGGSPTNFDYMKRPRRQELPERFLENGSIYVFKPAVLLQGGNRLGGKVCLYPMPKHCSQQVDDLADFELCNAIVRGLS